MASQAGIDVTNELIDRLYAALFSEAPWQDFVERSCDLLPNAKTVLFCHHKTSGMGAMSLSGGLDDGMVSKFNDHFYSINPWIDHAMIRPLGKVMQADEMLPRSDLKCTEFFQDYLRPQEIETGLGVTLHRHEGLHVFFSIVCADASDEELNDAKRSISRLVPHLERAFRVQGGRLAIKNGLCQRPEGIFQIDSRLRVVEADARALCLIAQTEALRIGPLHRLVSTDPDFLSCMQRVMSSELPVAVQHVHLKRKGGGIPIHACLYQPGYAGGVFMKETNCFIRLEDPVLGLGEGIRRFCRLHGLTGAEADIVAGLAAGLTLAQIAAKRKTSQLTIRTQLKAIFAKSGSGKQSDILCQVAVLARDFGPAITLPTLLPTSKQENK